MVLNINLEFFRKFKTNKCKVFVALIENTDKKSNVWINNLDNKLKLRKASKTTNEELEEILKDWIDNKLLNQQPNKNYIINPAFIKHVNGDWYTINTEI